MFIICARIRAKMRAVSMHFVNYKVQFLRVPVHLVWLETLTRFVEKSKSVRERLFVLINSIINLIFHVFVVDPCARTPCGINAICETDGLRAICKCKPGSVGNPLVRCYEGDCMENDHCPDHQACINYT